MAKKKTQKIDVALSANAKEFKKGLAKAEQDVGKFSKGASKAFSGLKTAGIGIAVGLGAAFVKAIRAAHNERVKEANRRARRGNTR